jgi:hypothetical protein
VAKVCVLLITHPTKGDASAPLPLSLCHVLECAGLPATYDTLLWEGVVLLLSEEQGMGGDMPFVLGARSQLGITPLGNPCRHSLGRSVDKPGGWWLWQNVLGGRQCILNQSEHQAEFSQGETNHISQTHYVCRMSCIACRCEG